MQRRQLLRGMAASATLQALLGGDAAAAGLKAIGQAEAFDYALLKGRARALATKAYQAPRSVLPKAIDSLDWDRHQAIRFRPDHALWGEDELRFRAQFFHLGLFFKSPVRIHELVDGRARELA